MPSPIDPEIPNDMLSEMEAQMKTLGVDTDGSTPTESDYQKPAPAAEVPAEVAELEEVETPPEAATEAKVEDDPEAEMVDPNAPVTKPAEKTS
jgi:hypothetical protein